MACNTLQTTTVENPTRTDSLVTEIHQSQFSSKNSHLDSGHTLRYTEDVSKNHPGGLKVWVHPPHKQRKHIVALFACSSCIKACVHLMLFICSHWRNQHQQAGTPSNHLATLTWLTQLLVCANRLEFRDTKPTIPWKPLLLVAYIRPAWTNTWSWRGLANAASMAFAATSEPQIISARCCQTSSMERNLCV